MAQTYESVYEAMMLYRSLIERNVFTVREGLTKQQGTVLVGVDMYEPVSSGTLAKYLSLQPQNMSRSIVDLESKGLVKREVDPENRRQVILTLSDEGKRFIANHRKKVHANLESSLSALSEDERNLLIDVSQIASTLLRKTIM